MMSQGALYGICESATSVSAPPTIRSFLINNPQLLNQQIVPVGEPGSVALQHAGTQKITISCWRPHSPRYSPIRSDAANRTPGQRVGAWLRRSGAGAGIGNPSADAARIRGLSGTVARRPAELSWGR
jgi:hypothetical protein